MRPRSQRRGRQQRLASILSRSTPSTSPMARAAHHLPAHRVGEAAPTSRRRKLPRWVRSAGKTAQCAKSPKESALAQAPDRLQQLWHEQDTPMAPVAVRVDHLQRLWLVSQGSQHVTAKEPEAAHGRRRWRRRCHFGSDHRPCGGAWWHQPFDTGAAKLTTWPTSPHALRFLSG